MKWVILFFLILLTASQGIAAAEEWGEMPRFGFRVKEIPEAIRDVLPFESVGAQVLEVTEGSAAAKAGLRTGDIILKVSGRWVHSAKSLDGFLSRLPLDQKLQLEIFRKGRNYQILFYAVKPKPSPQRPTYRAYTPKEEKHWAAEKAHITIICPILAGPEDINRSTYYGLGFEGGYRIYDMISLSAQIFTCSEELTRDETNFWTTLSVGVRLDLNRIMKTRVGNFFLRPGIVLSYLHEEGKVNFASPGFGISVIFGPEFKLSSAHTLGVFFGWDRYLVPHAGKRTGAPSPRNYEYSKNSFYGGLCLRIMFFGNPAKEPLEG